MKVKHLTKEEKKKYLPQLEEFRLNQKLDEDFSYKKAQQIFLIEENKIIAASSLNCYHGHWMFRNCVVDKKHWGKGLQKKLIEERLNFLGNKGIKKVSVSVAPDNKYSLNNLLTYGFKIQKGKRIIDGKEYLKLKKEW